ncbi:MAG: glycosyltransferase family 39 protein [bacterium]
MTKAINFSKLFISLALLLLLGQFVLQISLARFDSQTTDEAVHLSAGYTYLTRRDFRYNPEHPILIKALCAVPLLFVDIKHPSDEQKLWDDSRGFFFDSWWQNRTYGEKLLYSSSNDAERILFWGRLPVVFLTLILGLSILYFARKLYSSAGALVAVALYSLNPVVNAHGHLITTDIAIALGFFLSTIAALYFFKKRNFRNFIFLTLALVFSALVKYTAVILIPTIVALFIYSCIAGFIERGKRVKTFLFIILLFALTWALVFAAYGFKIDQIPPVDSISDTWAKENYPQKQVEVTSNRQTFDKALRFAAPVLLPRDYFKGLFMVLTHAGGGHDSFLLGKVSNSGWWYYFPVVFVAKNPIPALVLIGLGFWAIAKTKDDRKEGLFILTSALIYLLFAMSSKANLGVRHILPIFPLLFLGAASLARLKLKILRIVIILLIAWLVFESISAFPYYLSYFNQLFGGRQNGYRVASDSNLDWGRDLKEIAEYLQINSLEKVYIDYDWNGASSLKYYGITAKVAKNLKPSDKGYLVIGGSKLDSPEYDWLDSYEVYDKITPSVFVYKIDQQVIPSAPTGKTRDLSAGHRE